MSENASSDAPPVISPDLRASEPSAGEDAVYMLNALWLRPEGGEEAYRRYAAAVAPLLRKAGARVLPAYRPRETVIGHWDPDLFFLVEYPSWDAFQEMIRSPEYGEVRPLRQEALQKSLLIRCERSRVLESLAGG